MNKNESKYFYTASLMNQALLQLLEKKDIELITVTEITKKAGVNRSTFYLHYDTVYELLEETLANANRAFISSFQVQKFPTITTQKDAFLITEEFLVPYLNFCKEHKRLLQLVYQKPQLFQRKNTYQAMYDAIFYPAISLFVKEETQRIYTLEFFTQGVVGIIHKWIALDCKTEIPELIKIIKNCVGYSVS
ncbi:MAG: TetR/AcrR family transcriptional regulator [Clostridia bacterium]|nr:TetR/AcrR family transcriptional regulator [Clostridia bacterium]